MAETYLIEIREGSGEPGFIELKPGVELAPLGVGTEGAWRIRGAGVLGVHLYLYFDGQALFAQSADQTKPAVVNGRPVGGTWTPLTAPATIALGTARLFFRPNADASDDEDQTIAQAPPSEAVDAAGDEDRTMAIAPPVRAAAPIRPFQPGAFPSTPDESTRFAPIGDDGPDSEATRIVPLSEGLVGTDTPEIGSHAVRAMGPAVRPPPPGAPVRPAAGVPWSSATPPPLAPPGGAPGNLPPFAQRPTSPDIERQEAAGLPGQDTTVFQPDGPRPTALGSGPFPRPPLGDPAQPPGLLNIPPPSPQAPAKPEGSRLGKEWRAAPTSRKILYILLLPALGGAFWVIFASNDPPPARPKAKPTSSADGASSAMQASTSASSASNTPAGPTPPPVTAQPPPPPSSQSHTTPPTTPPPANSSTVDGGDRRERTAADYVSTGQYEQAAQIYDQLAQEHSENPAFGEAARILRRKLDAGLR
jgi:hypothetical protein